MRRSAFVIWLFLLTASVGWILWPREELRQGLTLGIVVGVKGSVQVRTAGSFSWKSVAPGAKLLALDSLATSRGSEVRFQLTDGTEIVLPEDAQLKIQPQVLSQGVTISVVKGGVSVQADAPKSEQVRGGMRSATQAKA